MTWINQRSGPLSRRRDASSPQPRDIHQTAIPRLDHAEAIVFAPVAPSAGVQVVPPCEHDLRIQVLGLEVLHFVGDGVLAVHASPYSAAQFREFLAYCHEGRVPIFVVVLELFLRTADPLRVRASRVHIPLIFRQLIPSRRRKPPVSDLQHGSPSVVAADGSASRSFRRSSSSSPVSLRRISVLLRIAKRLYMSRELDDRVNAASRPKASVP